MDVANALSYIGQARHSTRGEAVLGILLAGHAEVLPLRKFAQLSQVARGYYQLTRRRLLAWRVMKVLVAKSPGVLGERPTGAISVASVCSHKLIYQLGTASDNRESRWSR